MVLLNDNEYNHMNIIEYLEKEKLKYPCKESYNFRINKNIKNNHISERNIKKNTEKEPFKLKEQDYNEHIISNDPTYNWLS